jgi:hypothetical protein
MFRPSGEALFFAPPKKSTQKKGEPEGLPAARVPCASRDFERSPNSQHLPRLRLANPARQAGSLILKIPAMLGGARRDRDSKPDIRKFHPEPVCTHRVPQQIRETARTLLERIEHREIASCARPRICEELRGSALADE